MKVLLLAMEAQQARGLVKNKLFGVLGLFCTRVRTHKNIFKLLQRFTSLFRTHFQYLDKRNCMKQCVSTHLFGTAFSQFGNCINFSSRPRTSSGIASRGITSSASRSAPRTAPAPSSGPPRRGTRRTTLNSQTD